MTWIIDVNSTNRKFQTGDIVCPITDPHKDRILSVFRVSRPIIYLEAASGTFIPIFSKLCQDIRHTIQLVPPTILYIYSAIEYPSDSSSNSTCNDSSSNSDLPPSDNSDSFTPPNFRSRASSA